MVEDIGETPDSSPTIDLLQRAIASVPDDEAPQLVLADLLQSVGDPRGELIVLDLRERVGDLVDREGITRLLFLAAEYSFPRALPEESALPFTGYGSKPPRFATHYARTHYDVRYRDGLLEVIVDAQPRAAVTARMTIAPNAWTAEETAVILRLIGDAIREKTPLELLRFPYTRDALPMYDGGPLRGYKLAKGFLDRHGLAPNRYGLAPRDFDRWMRLWSRVA